MYISISLQCSYHSCHRSVETNKAAMFNFLSGVGNVGQRYTCYYNPADQTSAILSIVSVHTVIHCMLWPALAVVFGKNIQKSHSTKYQLARNSYNIIMYLNNYEVLISTNYMFMYYYSLSLIVWRSR